jgi:apolipoprotein N-acyltransferase
VVSIPLAATAWVLPIGSGVLLGLSFPPYGMGPMGWIALVPLFIRWTQAQSVRHLYVEAYACFLVACVIAFHWVVLHPVRDAAAASLGGLLFFPLLLSLPAALALPFRKRWGLLSGLLVLIVLHVSMEWALHHGPFAFPWPLLAHTQSTFDPFRQMVDLSGPSVLSAWILLLNAGATAALMAPRRWIRGAAIGTVAMLLVGSALYGQRRTEANMRVEAHTRALLVQPGLEASAWADLESPERLSRLLRLSTTALDTTSPADVVIWPETALYLPADSATWSTKISQLISWSARQNTTLLTGAIEAVGRDAVHKGRYYNAALLIDTTRVQAYRKNYLVPFAEFVPLIDQVPGLRRLRVPSGGVAGYERGRLQPTLVGDTFQAGALICFESLFTHHIRSYVDPASTARPIDFMVTIAQDGWWGPSAGYQQHIAFSQLRAIATRRAMAFVTVSGRTGLIDPHGRLSAATEWMMPTVRRVEIPHATALSPYVRFGDIVSRLALLASAACGIAAIAWTVQRPDR